MAAEIDPPSVDFGQDKQPDIDYDSNGVLTEWSPTMRSMSTVHKEKLMSDLRAVIAEAEELLRMTSDQGGAGAADVRDRVKARMNQAKADLVDLQEAAIARAKEAGHATDEFVHENPWRSIGIAAGIGLVTGLLISRR